MEIIINGTPKEIAELALELQDRQKKNIQSDDVIKKQIELVSKASEWVHELGQYETLTNLSFALAELYNAANVL